MFPLNGTDLAIIASTLGVAALFAALARAIVRTAVPGVETPKPGTTLGGQTSEGAQLVVGLPTIWCGRNDPEQTRRAAGIVQRAIGTVAPGIPLEIRFTIDTWEWRCPKEMSSQTRERLDMAMHLLAIRWRRIEEEGVAQTADREHLLRQWETLALRFIGVHEAGSRAGQNRGCDEVVSGYGSGASGFSFSA
jgi:hypothetical protein